MTDHTPPDPAALSGLWAYLGPALSAVFGGGIIWGATRTKLTEHAERIKDHTDKIAALEAAAAANREVVAALPTKSDLHAQTLMLQSQIQSGFENMTRLIIRKE